MGTNFRKEEIVLASGSPRRKELLEQIGISFTIHKSEKEEEKPEGSPDQVVMELAGQKASEAAAFCAEGTIVLGADTVISLGGSILGKPRDREDAKRMLQEIQGKTHQVYTGVCLLRLWQGRRLEERFYACTDVSVAAMCPEEIERYLDTGEYEDKAGAYGIQGKFAPFIREIRGDFYNVVGLPLHQLYIHLKGMVQEG